MRDIVQQRYRKVSEIQGQRKATESRISQLTVELEELKRDVDLLERVTGLLTSVSEERQHKAQKNIEQMVTWGLQEIFDDSLSFHIVQTIKAKNASVEFMVRTTLADGKVVETPVLDSRGGGLAATIGFLLRAVVLLLQSGTKKENLLVLDETFSHVSEEYLGKLSHFLQQLVEKTGIQIVMVTHQPTLAESADLVYHFSNSNGKTVVRKER